MIGKKISHYSVTEKLGAGGMGEVYRATDTKLNRDVALKVLPEAFANDTQRMARFSREAQVLASLNHPNIASIYGLEEADGIRCLVLELVEGPTLAERIAAGPLPTEEALNIARQIAEALEAAHEKGIIHRDLKPANVKVTPEGTVKVLDFGLAKALEDDPSSIDISKSPTLSVAATQAGVILGTAAYMSPEQARGQAVDKRADIWAFGVVLYEMLTGKQTFQGETISDTLAAVLRAEVDWETLPKNTPSSIRRLLRRCLARDRKQRLQAIGEARITLEDHLAHPEARADEQERSSVSESWWRRFSPAVSAALAVALVLALVAHWLAPGREGNAVVRFSYSMPANTRLDAGVYTALDISPDGNKIAFVATRGGTNHIYLRGLDQLEATEVPGTEGADMPFFSPDSQWIGFQAEAQLWKVPVGGGPAVTLAPVQDSRGAYWGDNGTIVIARNATEGLVQVPDSGGTPVPITRLDPEKNERTHRWPQLLPGGQSVIFTVGTKSSPDYYDNATIEAVNLKTGTRHVLVEGARYARYLPLGYLVFARSRSLFAVRFDADKLEVRGVPVPILEGVLGDPTTGSSNFSVGEDGSLGYVPGDARGSMNRIAWLDRSDSLDFLPIEPRNYLDPSLSPDGRRLAVIITEGENSDVWIYSFDRGTLTRFTFGGSHRAPIWSPDGKHVGYAELNAATDKSKILWKPADGSSEASEIAELEGRVYPQTLSRDGRYMAATQISPDRLSDVIALDLGQPESPRPLVATEFEEYSAQISPDGRWLAYVSTETGQYEVYVRPFQGPGGKWQISTEGGEEVRWSGDGRHLYFRFGTRLMEVPVQTTSTFEAGTPRVVSDAMYDLRIETTTTFQASPTGSRFLTIQPAIGSDTPGQINVVLNWAEELRRRLGQE